MGMPCEINSILKLSSAQGYPPHLELQARHQATKQGYRIFPLDVPIALVDDQWQAHADIIIRKLTWEQSTTAIAFEITRIYEQPFDLKG